MFAYIAAACLLAIAHGAPSGYGGYGLGYGYSAPIITAPIYTAPAISTASLIKAAPIPVIKTVSAPIITAPIAPIITAPILKTVPAPISYAHRKHILNTVVGTMFLRRPYYR